MVDIPNIVIHILGVSGFIFGCRLTKWTCDAELRIENLEAQVRQMYDKIKTLETLNSRR